jgi:hypothetical protein
MEEKVAPLEEKKLYHRTLMWWLVVREELNDERRRRCYLQDFHDSRKKKMERQVLYLFFMSESGDVFPCIETRGVNLYA